MKGGNLRRRIPRAFRSFGIFSGGSAGNLYHHLFSLYHFFSLHHHLFIPFSLPLPLHQHIFFLPHPFLSLFLHHHLSVLGQTGIIFFPVHRPDFVDPEVPSVADQDFQGFRRFCEDLRN
jgi:hypothetical protein